MEKTFVQLMKDSKKGNSFKLHYKLAVLGDCATQHLSTALRGCGYNKEINLEVFDAEYNQVTAQIIDQDSELYKFQPDGILIYLCSEKLYEDFCQFPTKNRDCFADTVCEKIENNWKLFNSKQKAQIFQFNFAENNDAVFGNFANSLETSYIYQLRKLNFLLQQAAVKYKNLTIIDLQTIQTNLGRNSFFDEAMYFTSKMPISLTALPKVANQVVAAICAILGKGVKCVVLDLDNTLWGGVIGDDGLGGIQIGELGLGHAYTEFQIWLKELKKRGVLLAVCSKNNESTAKEPFEKHPDMVLKLEDISIFVANWQDKASNIQFIQQTLNIGMDSLVFIDDNPFERDVVSSLIPDITVPDMPQDPAKYVTYLKSLNLFETASYSPADEDRTSQYQAEAGRTITLQQFQDYNKYLQSLEMKAVCKNFDEFNFARIAQLTQRSNQFNLRTVRYTQAEIEDLSKNDEYITLYFTLDDKFGSYGLISVVILKKLNPQELFVDTWLMSCRVLKRGVEEFVVNRIMDIALKNGYKAVIGEYIPTAKNKMVEDIYSLHGFTNKGDGRFVAQATNYEMKNNFIEELK